MWYINSTPTDSGSYGNPQSNKRDGTYELPDELLQDYLNTMGFATLTVKNGIVTKVTVNQTAYDAYQDAHPAPAPPTPAEQRETAYNTEEIIEWDGAMITVTHAAELWNYYAAEGSDKAYDLQEKIAKAKEAIREKYPDSL